MAGVVTNSLKERAVNNFPISASLGNGAVVPFG